MRNLLRGWLAVLLALCVFSQGIAAAGMSACLPSTDLHASHGGHTSPARNARAAPDHASPHAAHAAGMHAADATTADAPAADAQATTGHGKACSTCPACALGSAMPIGGQAAQVPAPGASPAMPARTPTLTFLCEGLERPPRT